MNIKNPFSKLVSSEDLVLLVALVVALALVWNTVSAMQRNYRLQQKYDRLKAEVSLQEIENQNMKYQIQYLKSDSFLELQARDKFNKASTGEHLVYLPSNGQAAQQAVVASTNNNKKPTPTGWRANLSAWWHFIKGDLNPKQPL